MCPLLFTYHGTDFRCRQYADLCLSMMERTQRNQVIIVKPSLIVHVDWYSMMHADSVVLDPACCAWHVSNASLATEAISLSNL